MEGMYNLYSQDRNGWSAFRNHEEFQEEDIWAVCDINDPNSKIRSFNSSTITSRRVPTAAKMISRAINPPQEPNFIQQSAPITIPEWSKVHGFNSKKASNTVSFHGDDVMRDSWKSDEDEEIDEELDGELIPPHEWITKKLARTRISSFSVFEGAGRTLKGRDLSRVRNAVLSRTGFLE